jgi:hypothetical protein
MRTVSRAGGLAAALLVLAPAWAAAQNAPELNLSGGRAVARASLAKDDPDDRLDLTGKARCKVFAVRLEAGRKYKITMTSKDLDSYLRLENPNRLNETGDDNGAGGKDARIVYECKREGTYRVVCTRRRGPAEGEFTLTVEEDGAAGVEVAGKDKAGGTELRIRDGRASINGQIAATDPPDKVRQGSRCKVYTLRMVQGGTYRIHMTSGNFDTYLRLEDPAGQQVAADDDSGGGLNSLINYPCPRTGTYRVIATTFRGGAAGDFTLAVTATGVPADNPPPGKGAPVPKTP